jgi:hypothetical protein
MCRFNSFSPGQKAILVGISGIHENPRFPPLSNKNEDYTLKELNKIFLI